MDTKLRIIPIGLAVIIIILLGILFFYNPVQGPTVPGGLIASSTGQGAGAMSPDGHVFVGTPQPNATIASPVSIAGTVGRSVNAPNSGSHGRSIDVLSRAPAIASAAVSYRSPVTESAPLVLLWLPAPPDRVLPPAPPDDVFTAVFPHPCKMCPSESQPPRWRVCETG